MKFVVGSSLNAGFVSGSPRYNYGEGRWEIPADKIERREKLRATAAKYGVDPRAAAMQFSAAPDIAASLIVGAGTAEHVLADVSAFRTPIPMAFWDELRRQGLIEPDAPTPRSPPS